MKNSVKKSLNILQNLYMSGLVPYPRVCNDFEKKPFFQFFPHPSLPILKDINEPLPSNKIKTTKKSSLLLLTLMKLVKPSTIEKMASKIDDFLNDDLEFINENKKETFENMNKIYLSFLEKKSITEKELIEHGNSLYMDSNKDIVTNSLKLYNLNDIKFYYTKKDKAEKNKYIFFKRKKTEDIGMSNLLENKDDGIFENLDDLVMHIRQLKTEQNPIIRDNKDGHKSINR